MVVFFLDAAEVIRTENIIGNLMNWSFFFRIRNLVSTFVDRTAHSGPQIFAYDVGIYIIVIYDTKKKKKFFVYVI